MLTPAASLAGSISPMMSANLVPGDEPLGVAIVAGHQAIGTSSAGTLLTSCRPRRVIGRYGSSCTGMCGSSMYGISSSRKRRHQPHQPALGLALFAEEQHVVLREDGDVELGNHRVVVADDARIELLAGLQLGEEVVVNFLLDGFRLPAAGAQLGERRGFGRSWKWSSLHVS